jgi:sialate O-acetylesterase
LGTVLGVEAKSQDQTMLLDLRGKWRFEIGDDPARANPSFNDASWVDISVPSPWEDQGFPGYDGFAWYRKHFTADPQWEGKVLYLSMGKIDDADDCFRQTMRRPMTWTATIRFLTGA